MSAAADIRDLAARALAEAERAGADEADLRVFESRELQLVVRLGEVEVLKEAGDRGVALRVFKGRRRAVVGTTELDPAGLERLAREAVALAAVCEPDDTHRLPAPDLFAAELPDLDLCDDGAAPDTAAAIALARDLEAATLGADPRIDNCQQSRFTRGLTRTVYVTSNGFAADWRRTGYSLAIQPVARGRNGERVTDAWFQRAPHFADLRDVEVLAAEAARRVLRRLDARRAPTGAFPVVFEPRMAARLAAMVFRCVSGTAVWRGLSYLADRRGERVASERFTLVDDPHRPRGLGSRPCDGEGLACRRLALVDGGALRSFATDLESARRLDLPPTGHGLWGGGVGPSNLHVLPGDQSPEAIIAGAGRGLVVIDMMGQGFDATSGHWSQGCTGLWIEDGAVSHPVSEVTVAGHLDEVLGGVDAVGDDLDFSLGAVTAPTLRVAAMTVAGG